MAAKKQDLTERYRADRALAAAAELGVVLDIIERNLRATKYATIHEATTDLLDLIRVGREHSRICYHGDMPQLTTALAEIHRMRSERAAMLAAVEAAGRWCKAIDANDNDAQETRFAVYDAEEATRNAIRALEAGR